MTRYVYRLSGKAAALIVYGTLSKKTKDLILIATKSLLMNEPTEKEDWAGLLRDLMDTRYRQHQSNWKGPVGQGNLAHFPCESSVATDQLTTKVQPTCSDKPRVPT